MSGRSIGYAIGLENGRPGLKTGFTDSAREQWYDRPLEGVGEGGVRGAGRVGLAGVMQQGRGVQTLAN